MPTFDTLQASKDLQSHGFEQEQAEAIAQVVRNGQNELATKSDVASVRSDVENVKWTLGAMIGVNLVVMIGGFSMLATFINQ
jgi:hypothetical protein